MIGESGLGKTMFVQWVVNKEKEPVAVLTAGLCKTGVEAAVQKRLPGTLGNDGLIRSMLYSGRMKIVIDGLNEVDTTTGVRVLEFARSYPNSNLLITTQAIPDWNPPKRLKEFYLQPLEKDQIIDFLFSRDDLINQMETDDLLNYKTACQRFVDTTLTSGATDDDNYITETILSNPMDLTIIARMLAAGQWPDVRNLQEHWYEIMAADYQYLENREFPLGRFAEESFQMRSEDRAYFSDDFSVEIRILARHKMVYVRSVPSEDKPSKRWYFRHDKIAEYFILQSFLGQNNPRPLQYLHDARFRGVYTLLATRLPFEEARSLRDMIIRSAAETNDHTVSDQFVKLFSSREKLEAEGPPWLEHYPIATMAAVRTRLCEEEEMAEQAIERARLADTLYRKTLSLRRLLDAERETTLAAALIHAFCEMNGEFEDDNIKAGKTYTLVNKQNHQRLIYRCGVSRQQLSLQDIHILAESLVAGDDDLTTRAIIANTESDRDPKFRSRAINRASEEFCSSRGIIFIESPQIYAVLQIQNPNNFWRILKSCRGRFIFSSRSLQDQSSRVNSA